MERSGNGDRTRAGAVWTGVFALVLAAVLAACGSDSGSSSSSASSSGGKTAALSGNCGKTPVKAPDDPDGVVAALPQDAQTKYNDYPGVIRKSAFADWTGKPGPWKIGYSALANNSAFTENLITGFKDAFAKAKAQGLVTGELQLDIRPDQATQTPAQQIAGFQSMVRNGVDGVIMLPLSGDEIAPAITKAGKENHVPTVILGNTNPSDYSIAVNSPNISAGTAKTLAVLGGKGNVLVVRGLPGVPAETYGYKQIEANLKQCPDVKVIGTVNGNWNNAAAKTAVTQFLASHPGKIDGVIQNGIMAQGIIQAFEQAGRPVPPVSMVGAQAGDLAWFKDHLKDGYNTGGSSYNGVQQADSAFRVLLRTLAGKEPKATDIALAPTIVDKSNVAPLVPPGATLNTVDDPLGDPQEYAPDAYLDELFTKPGNAEPGNG